MDSFVFFSPSSSMCVHQCDVFFLHERTIGAAISSTLLVKQIPPHIVWLSLVPLSIIVGLRGSRDLFFFFCSLHVNRETIEQQQPPNIMKEREKKINNKKALWVVEYITIYTVRINAAVCTWHTNIGLVSCICLEDDGRHVRAGSSAASPSPKWPSI